MQLSNLVQAAVSFASTFEVDANAEYRKFHRRRRMPRRLDENHNTTAELEMPLFYRKEFTAVSRCSSCTDPYENRKYPMCV